MSISNLRDVMAEKNNKDSKIKILLFEREPDTIKIVQNALSNITYILEPVMNAFSGMKSIKEDSPDIVIAHYDFPELNGLGLLKKIQDSGHTIPVILYVRSAAPLPVRADWLAITPDQGNRLRDTISIDTNQRKTPLRPFRYRANHPWIRSSRPVR